MGQQFGSATIKTNGRVLRSLAGAKIDLGGPVRETVVGSNRVHGYSQKIKQARIECEISLQAGDSLEEIRRLTGAVVTFECDTGQTYIVRDAAVIDTLTLTEGSEGGKIPVVIEGQPAEEAL